MNAYGVRPRPARTEYVEDAAGRKGFFIPEKTLGFDVREHGAGRNRFYAVYPIIHTESGFKTHSESLYSSPTRAKVEGVREFLWDLFRDELWNNQYKAERGEP